MKKTVTIHLFMEQVYKADYSGREWVPDVWSVKVDESERRIYIGPQEITIEVPEDFNPVPQQVAALKKQKAEALAAYLRTVAELNERLSKLLALTNEVDA
jgi:hypothetical protein